MATGELNLPRLVHGIVFKIIRRRKRRTDRQTDRENNCNRQRAERLIIVTLSGRIHYAADNGSSEPCISCRLYWTLAGKRRGLRANAADGLEPIIHVDGLEVQASESLTGGHRSAVYQRASVPALQADLEFRKRGDNCVSKSLAYFFLQNEKVK